VIPNRRGHGPSAPRIRRGPDPSRGRLPGRSPDAWAPRLAGILALFLLPEGSGAAAVPADAIHLDLRDPRAALHDAALVREAVTDQVSSLSPTPLGDVRRALAALGAGLGGIPDADGLPAPADPDLMLPPHAFVPGLLQAAPRETELRGAHLFSGDQGPHRYGDGDRNEEGASLRARRSLAWAPTDAVHAVVTGRLEAGRVRTRVTWTRAALTWRGAGLRVTVGREPRWWGSGRLHEVLLTTNARAVDAVEIASDGANRLPFGLGVWRMSSLLGYLDDADRPNPHPLLFGQRVVWRPGRLLELGVARTVMLGGAGRTQQLGLEDAWNILLSRDENRIDYDGYQDTDQKAAFDATVYLGAVARRIPGVRGARFSYRYAGDDSFEGILPTRVAHLIGLTLELDRTRVVAEYLQNTTAGVWYWNNEHPQGYVFRDDFLATDVGWDTRSTRVRVVHALTRDWGLRTELFVDRRGHRFHGEPGIVRPQQGSHRTTAVEGALAVARRLPAGRRMVVEYRYRDVDGFTYARDRRRAQHRASVILRAF